MASKVFSFPVSYIGLQKKGSTYVHPARMVKSRSRNRGTFLAQTQLGELTELMQELDQLRPERNKHYIQCVNLKEAFRIFRKNKQLYSIGTRLHRKVYCEFQLVFPRS